VTILIVTHDPRIASEVDRVIAIRDGRTSTETTRQVLAPLLNGDGDGSGDVGEGEEIDHEVTYEELVVLDTAGRLQVPRDYLEEFNIGDRARVEMTDEGILIRPVEGRDTGARVSEEEAWEVQVSGLYVEQDEPPQPHHRRALNWLRQRLSRSPATVPFESKVKERFVYGVHGKRIDHPHGEIGTDLSFSGKTRARLARP
jgi:hypothetical protein